ncbi:MAG: zincin-like metallopeptidase domain-containing protein, partial [Deinococcota bacterium]|nr:zincin-like metallopeptidase domain-containing protein [Deinococcota bacterium]
QVTERILEQLRLGVAPWVKPWSGNAAAGLPRNYVSGRPYSGVNVLLTWLSAALSGYSDSRWLTAKQIKELGGSFKGEKATRIVFAKSYTRKPGTDNEPEGGSQPEEDTFFVHKLFYVFNVQQVSGLELEPEEAPPPFEERIATVEAFIDAQGIAITHGGDRAFYSPSKDLIVLPHPGSYTEAGAYYATALHELAHATAHSSRLGRKTGRKGTTEYAVEELVAELTAAFLCAELGIPGQLQHAEYVGHWVRLLTDSERAIFEASKEATAAANYLRAKAAGDPDLFAAEPLAEAA